MLVQEAIKLKKIVADGGIETLDHDHLVLYAMMFPEIWVQSVTVAGLDGVCRETEQVVIPLGNDKIIAKLRAVGKAPAAKSK